MAKRTVWRSLKCKRASTHKTLCLFLTGNILTSVFIMVFWLQVQDQTPALSGKTRQRDIQNGEISSETDTQPITGTGCTFAGTFEDNFRKLGNLPFTNSTVLMQKLGFNRVPTAVLNTSLPVIVTGVNSRFYGVVQGLVKTVHETLLPKYPDLKLIIYDMGLSDNEFEQYVFQEFGHVWWVDSSVRFISNDLERALQYLTENGALFFTYAPVLNVALHTHVDTFRHFYEDPCPFMYFGEVEAGNVAFINNDVGRLILNRWVACALDASCIAPTGARKSCPWPPTAMMGKEKIGTCHRFDQSALSIILRRLYHERNDYPLVENPIRIIKVIRRQMVQYFPVEN